MTFYLFILAFFGAVLLFDYFKTRDLARGKDLQQATELLQKEVEHLKERVEHLETIVSEQDLDIDSKIEANSIRKRTLS